MINHFVCFFINLEKCTQRYKHCTSLLQKLNFDEINHIIPTDKCSKEILQSEQMCKGNCAKKGHPASFKSLSFTTKKILEKILTLPDNYYFIFEDDIHLNDNIEPSNFKNLINQFICKYPNQPIYYLGLILEKKHIDAYNNNTFKTKMGWGTHAYMINHQGANFLLQNVNCWHTPLDGLYKSTLNDNYPLIGYEYRNKKDPCYIGIFVQGRNEKWYTKSNIPSREWNNDQFNEGSYHIFIKDFPSYLNLNNRLFLFS